MKTASLYGLIAERAASDGTAGTDTWQRLTELTDPSEFRPKLREDIEVRVFEQRWGQGYAMVANPRDLIHYRLQLSDLELLRLMDGTRTVKEMVVERFEDSGELELAGVIDIVRQLYEGNFLEQRYVDVPEMVKRALDPVSEGRRKARQFGKTLTIEWEGAHRLVSWFYTHGLKYVFNWPAVIVLILVAVVGFGFFVDLIANTTFAIAGQSIAISFIPLSAIEELFHHPCRRDRDRPARVEGDVREQFRNLLSSHTFL